MKTNIVYILGIFIWLSLNSCSESGDDTSKQEYEQDIALSSLKQKSISLTLVGSELVDKVRFDIGDNVEYFKLSSEKPRKVTASYCKYSKKSGEEASLEIEFTLGDYDYYCELHLTFKEENSGSYKGYVEYGDGENYEEETIYGTFVISDYSKETNEEYNEIDIEYLVKNVWYSTETELKRFFAFFDDCSYKHYCDLGNTIVKDEGGEYVFDEDESTLKLYNSNNKCEFDFKILKLTESELWLSAYDVIDKKYPSSPSMKLRVAKESDDIPGFITGEEEDEKGYFNISIPVVRNITTNSAVIKSTIIFEYVNCTKKGICYAARKTPTIDDKCINQNSNAADITLSKLEPNEVYYVRTFAVINGQVHYGGELRFVTNDLFVDELEVSSYFFHFKIKRQYEGANYAEMKAGLCYGTSPNPTLETANITKAREIPLYFKKFSDSPDGNINMGTTYYLRPYTIENGKVTYYGETKITTVGRDLILKLEHEKGSNNIKCSVDVNEGGPYEVKLYFHNYGYNGPFVLVKHDFGTLDSKSNSKVLWLNKNNIEGMGFDAYLYIEAVDVNTKYKYVSNTFYEGNLQK